MNRRTYERKRKRFYREQLYRSDTDSSSNEDAPPPVMEHDPDETIEAESLSPRSSPRMDVGQGNNEVPEMLDAADPLGTFQNIEDPQVNNEGSDNGDQEIDWDFLGEQSDASDVDFSDNMDDTSEESDAEEVNYNDEANTPIFEGSRLTLIQSFVALLAMFFRCQLSIQCFKIILSTIALHLPENNKFFSSLHYFNKFLPNNQLFVKKNQYCKKCCVVEGYGECLCADKKKGQFLTFSITRQLDVLFQRDSFRNLLNHRFNRRKKCEANIEDIYDGEVYKTYVNNGFLSSPNNISFLWYTDGVPLYKSSKYSVWPLFFIINELPYAVRYLPENVIFGGLWFGSDKPYFNSFFIPLNEELKLLQSTGVSLSARDERGERILVKAKILCGCCDLPARALVLNMNQFNGLYSCHKCLIRGKKYFYTETSSVFVFSNDEGNEIPLRNLADTRNHINEAIATDKAVFGFKGPTLLTKFVPNIITCTAIDSMHAIFSGVAKKMVTLFFNKSYSGYEFSLSNVASLVDERIKSIKPPNFVKRLPRDFATHVNYLKSAEFKVWFFYFSIPVLLDLMSEPYLSHYISLVEACMLLSSESISYQDIDRAEILLKEYVLKYEEYFGTRFMTANMHMLLHLADTVRQLGPLWVTSCFPLEDLNGKLTRLVHGTRCAESQIWRSFLSLQKLPKHQTNMQDNPALSNFLDSLKTNIKCRITKDIGQSMHVVGKIKFLNNVPLRYNEALYLIGVNLRKAWSFQRLKKGSLLYTSLLYKNNMKTFSSCASYINRGNVEKIGIIYCFLQVKECSCIEENVCGCQASYFVILKKCDALRIENSSFIKEILVLSSYEAIPVNNLLCINYCVAVNGRNFSIKPIKAFEFE